MVEKILFVGADARSHALAWRMKQTQNKGDEIYFAPGNGGTANLGKNVDIGIEETDKLVGFAIDNNINFTVVSPELPLVKGGVDAFKNEYLEIYGPTQEAAQLEGSKIFAAKFNDRHNISQPKYAPCDDFTETVDFVRNCGWKKIAVKADGLASGQGVVITNTLKETENAIRERMVEEKFGEAGKKILLQEGIEGQEVSITVLSDGTDFIEFPEAVDHKSLYDKGEGPNTGGMGAFSPVPFVTDDLRATIRRDILEPAISGMALEERPFVGTLYVGLMLTKDGPKVLEYNVRFGDPEAQVLMMLYDGNLLKLLRSCARGNLDRQQVSFRKGFAVGVVLAAAGYPENPQQGDLISGLDKEYGRYTHIFQAGTKKDQDWYKVNGGRVLTSTGWASNLEQAIAAAYLPMRMGDLHFNSMQYRRDIGQQGLSLT